MTEKSSAIAGEIEDYRDRLGQDLHDLEFQVRKNTDWRTYYEKNPWLFIGTAVGGGLLLGELIASRNGSSNGAPYTGRSRGVASEVLESDKVALVSYGTAKAKEFLSEVVPGFEEHLHQVNRSRPNSTTH